MDIMPYSVPCHTCTAPTVFIHDVEAVPSWRCYNRHVWYEDVVELSLEDDDDDNS